MTFTQLVGVVTDYCNLSSTEATTRVGTSINRHHRRITSELGLNATRFVTRSVLMTVGVRTVTFLDIEKIDRIIDMTDTTAIRPLTEVSQHAQRITQPHDGEPTTWSLQRAHADSVVVLTDTAPLTAYTLKADGWVTLSDLAGTDEPMFPESYHDILSWFVISEELLKKEKDKLAKIYEEKAEKLLSELRFFLADSPTLSVRARNTLPASLFGGGTGAGGGEAGTVAGLGVFNVMDYGALGDGAADDTAAIQAAIDAALGTLVGDVGPSGTVWIPNGRYLITETLNVDDHDGVTIHGLGQNTILSWNGDATGPMWSLYGSRMSALLNMKLTVEGGASLVNMIVQEQPPLVGTGLSSMNRYDRLLIEGNGDIEVGIYLKGDVTDLNNDTTIIEQCLFAGYTTAGIRLQGANCADIQVIGCYLLGIREADYGIKSDAGAGGQSAAFAVRDSVINGHMLADIYQHTVSSNGVILDGIYSEASECFFDTAGVTGGYGGIRMRNVLWDSAEKSGSLPVIRLGVQGPISIESCRFGSDFSKSMTVVWQPFPNSSNQPRGFSITNSIFWTTNTTLASIFTSTLPTYCRDVWAVQDNAGTQVQIDRRLMPNALSLVGRNAADSADIPLISANASDRVQLGNASQIVDLIGGRMLFPSTPIPSTNTRVLDDYQEEPNWALVLKGASGTASYTTQAGWWAKHGKTVFYGGEILLSSAGSLSGDLYIDIPVNVTDTLGYGGGPVILWAGLAGEAESLTMLITQAGSNKIYFYIRRAGDAFVYNDNLKHTDLTATTRLIFTGHYFANV